MKHCGATSMGVLSIPVHPLKRVVCTRNEQESKAPAQNRANWILWFGKPEGLVSLGPTAVRGTIGSGEGVLLLAK
jgi:hypothetical protein